MGHGDEPVWALLTLVETVRKTLFKTIAIGKRN